MPKCHLITDSNGQKSIRKQKKAKNDTRDDKRYFYHAFPSIMVPFISNTMFYAFCAIG